MINELTFNCSHHFFKVKVMEDKSVWAAAMKTGLNNYFPVALIEKQIEKAKKDNIKTNKKQLKKYEEDLGLDIDFLKNNNKETIVNEIIKQMGVRGFKLIKEDIIE